VEQPYRLLGKENGETSETRPSRARSKENSARLMDAASLFWCGNNNNNKEQLK
jgi:hypothetical protein